jgi:hypothetical protein
MMLLGAGPCVKPFLVTTSHVIGIAMTNHTLEADLALLEKAQALMEVERSLTATLEKVEPWLLSNTLQPKGHHTRVRPIPTTMDQVKQVLAVSRNFAPRTSAPAGWNPNAPVVGFSTPNPLPHQLRGGALAALQLERARQANETKKRRRREQDEERKAAKKLQEAQAMDVDADSFSPKAAQTEQAPGKQQHANPAQAPAARPRAAQRPQPQVLTTTMNLSDSSSSDDDNDDSD